MSKDNELTTDRKPNSEDLSATVQATIGQLTLQLGLVNTWGAIVLLDRFSS